MTKPYHGGAHANAEHRDTEALGLLVAIVDELGEIALTIAATIEAQSATQTIIARADELRRAANSLRCEADHLLGRLRPA